MSVGVNLRAVRIFRNVRIIWRMTGSRMSIILLKIGRILTALAVGAFAAYSSYEHMRTLAATHGQLPNVAAFLPISVDGLIVYGTWNMDARNRTWPRVCFWVGVAATLSANWLAAPPDLLSRVISAWAPVSLLCVIETWSRRNQSDAGWFGRAMASKPASLARRAAGRGSAEPAKARTPNVRGEKTANKVARVAKNNPGASVAAIAAKAGVSESTARRYVTPTPESA